MMESEPCTKSRHNVWITHLNFELVSRQFTRLLLTRLWQHIGIIQWNKILCEGTWYVLNKRSIIHSSFWDGTVALVSNVNSLMLYQMESKRCSKAASRLEESLSPFDHIQWQTFHNLRTSLIGFITKSLMFNRMETKTSRMSQIRMKKYKTFLTI